MHSLRPAMAVVMWLVGIMGMVQAHNVVEVAISPSGDSDTAYGQSQVPTATRPLDVRERSKPAEPSQSSQYDHQASRIALEKELETIDSMIDLQEQKMLALAKLRMQFQNQDAEATNERLGLGYRARASSEGRDQELRDAIDRRMDALAAQLAHRVSSERFDSYLIEKVMLPLPSDVAAVRIDKIRAFPTFDLTVVATQSGNVRFFSSPGPKHEVFHLDTNVPDVQSIELDLQSDPPVFGILGGGANAQVVFFSLDFSVLESTASRMEKQISINAHELFNLPPGSGASRPTAIAIARSARRSALAVARENGKLSFFAHNGTLLHEINASTHPVSVMATQRHYIALGSSAQAFIFSMSRHKHGELTVCEGSLASVVSLVFDVNHADILYAGTSDGEILLFENSVTAEGVKRNCRLAQRLIIERSSPVHVAVVKNHVIAASATEVAVFNLSRQQSQAGLSLSKVCSKSCESQPNIGSLRSVVTAENTHSTTIGIISINSAGTKSLLLLQSLLPSADSFGSDSSFPAWRALMVIVPILVVTITSQFFLRRSRDNNTDGSVNGSADWRKLLEKHGSSSAYMRGRATGGEQPQPHEYLGDPTMYGASVDAFTASRTRGKRSGASTNVNEAELCKMIEEARRDTLERPFDDCDDDDESD